jgi:hypothetical protein
MAFKCTAIRHPLDLIYAYSLASSSSHEQHFSDLVAMVAAMLSCQIHGNFVVRQPVNWERHAMLLVCCTEHGKRCIENYTKFL